MSQSDCKNSNKRRNRCAALGSAASCFPRVEQPSLRFTWTLEVRSRIYMHVELFFGIPSLPLSWITSPTRQEGSPVSMGRSSSFSVFHHSSGPSCLQMAAPPRLIAVPICCCWLASSKWVGDCCNGCRTALNTVSNDSVGSHQASDLLFQIIKSPVTLMRETQRTNGLSFSWYIFRQTVFLT